MVFPASHRISVLRGTLATQPTRSTFGYGTLTLSGLPFQCSSPSLLELVVGASTPASVDTGLGFSAFARHYSRNRFSSSGYLDVSVLPVPHVMAMCSPCVPGLFDQGVSPFGHRRFFARIRLTDAFRSMPRPSSAPDAKASPVRPSLLLLTLVMPKIYPGFRQRLCIL